MEYTHNELKVLWYLKRNGPIVRTDTRAGQPGMMTELAETLDIRRATLNYVFRGLENKCLIIRTYRRETKQVRNFEDKMGYNPLIKIELIDPQMYLPPLPAPMPLAAVVAHENEDLYHRIVHEPTTEEIIIALLSRNEQLQEQINKLQEIVQAQANEMMHSKQQHRAPEHLMSRVKGALTPEQWEALQHGPR